MSGNLEALRDVARYLHGTAFQLEDFATDGTAEVMVMLFSSHFIPRCRAGHLDRRQPAVVHQRSNVAVDCGEADAIHLHLRKG